MGYDRTAPKRAINVSLNDDLVRQARAHTRNLSGTIEDLLGEFVAREQDRKRAEDATVDRIVEGFNSFHRQHGLLSDEFSGL
jgi:antitoxin CcdA